MPIAASSAEALASGPLRLALVAGEASGDLLGGLLLQGLKARWPDLQAFGIGGPKLVAQGLEAWWPHERLSVFGYVDAIAALVPPVDPTITMKQLMSLPERKRASTSKPKI